MLGPIFNRELLTIPRRERHYVTRVVYLGALLIISITAYLATMGWFHTATLGDMARFGPLLFQILTFVQLALFLFFAALSAASAISQEKDRRTFILLLMTDLRNHEIVVGKLLGSLLPIGVLILATVPVLLFLLLLGGIGLHQVIEAVVIVTATALAAGSLGGLMALWRERTFQSLALTVLCLVLYLCLVRGLAVLEMPLYQMWFDPFVALARVHHPNADDSGFSPAYIFAMVMLGWSVLLNGLGLVMLRKWNPSGEPIMQREKIAEAEAKDAVTETDQKLNSAQYSVFSVQEEKKAVTETDQKQQLARATAHAAPGKVRPVDGNPILWREISTRAYGRRPLLVKLAYAVVLAVIVYSALAPLMEGQAPRPFQAAYGLIPIGVLSLLLVAAQATTAITSERDTGALDLLLVTDLTPKEFIFGKLGGICYNTKEFLLPPLILTMIYAYYGCLASPPARHPELRAVMNITTCVCIIGASLVLLAFAMVLGIHVALRTQNSRLAVIHALSTIFFLSVGTMICMALILINRRFEVQGGSFIFFLVAGIGGLWWVLNRERPSAALLCASIFCPLAVLYTVMAILVAKPGLQESADPLLPFLVVVGAFGFAVAAMLVPLLSEFDVALGRTSGGAD